MSRISLWPQGRVPYIIEAGLSNSKVVEAAIQQWNALSMSVRLVPGRDELDYVRFVAGEDCSSPRGRIGGEQQIAVPKHCRVGEVLHEIGHTVGLMHEHNRPDRDRYVSIAVENIYPALLSNFQARLDEDMPVDEYDWRSIMHYSQMAYSRNGGRTIIPNPCEVDPDALIGQRRELSSGDVERVNRLYADVTEGISR